MQGLVELIVRAEQRDKSLCRSLVYDSRGRKLLHVRILAVPEDEYAGVQLSRSKSELEMMASYGSPSVSYAVIAHTCFDRAWIAGAVIQTDEFIAARVETADFLIYIEQRVVVSALAVFGLVVYRASFDLDFSDREIPLKIGCVILSVPQTELHITVEIDLFGLRRVIHQGQP